jgi:hypothetical protein
LGRFCVDPNDAKVVAHLKSRFKPQNFSSDSLQIVAATERTPADDSWMIRYIFYRHQTMGHLTPQGFRRMLSTICVFYTHPSP